MDIFSRLVTAMCRKFFVYFNSGWIIPLAVSKKKPFWELGKRYSPPLLALK